MTAQTILKLIDKATADDTALLDEIDARTWCYVRGYEYLGCRYKEMFDYKCDKGNRYCNIGIPYTRCRGALKTIRPEGVFISVAISPRGNYCADDQFGDTPSPFLPTEELAELHAIIQALSTISKAKAGE